MIKTNKKDELVPLIPIGETHSKLPDEPFKYDKATLYSDKPLVIPENLDNGYIMFNFNKSKSF